MFTGKWWELKGNSGDPENSKLIILPSIDKVSGKLAGKEQQQLWFIIDFLSMRQSYLLFVYVVVVDMIFPLGQQNLHHIKQKH